MDGEIKVQSSNSSYKRRQQYTPPGPKRRRYILEPGLKGFICSCNFKEKECIREAYNILNEYGDLVYGPEGNQGETEEEAVNVEEDIEGLLKEIEAIQSVEKSGRRFQVVESGAKNFLFIRTNVNDPVKLAEMIVKDISDKKKHKTRHLLRLIPIEATCKAYLYDIKKVAQPLIEKYFKDAPKSFSIIYNHRNNNNVSKEEVITTIADMITSTRCDHVVNLKHAEISVIVEIVKNVALLGVVPHFIKYRKYNLSRLRSNSLSVYTRTGDGAKNSKPDADSLKTSQSIK
ncbi:hypothetical protein ILUMI_25654 [Ignelater luminosus]|uniref:THUMP domain-containing protein n=1 Tax=Ignelater luminosus TaxID=2038154 RepID=A0A8K0C821_IGNLU|nr:hypothetical protein ILUMI_25654 [Ignelater luminosus]